jgi:DNA adenine methylase
MKKKRLTPYSKAMNPLIRRVGGKFYSRKTILPLIPEHEIYVEPFVGGGSVFYGKKPSKVEVINDLDTEVYNCHLGGKKSGYLGKFAVTLSEEEFHAVRKSKPITPVDILIKVNVLQSNSYLGMCKTFINEESTRWRQKSPKDYPKYADRLKDTIILNESYENLFKYDSPTTFFYLDPPYEDSKKTTSNLYKSIDYHALRDLLKNLQGKFLLSINDSPFIRDLFKDFTIQEIATRYVLKKRTEIELLIKNY